MNYEEKKILIVDDDNIFAQFVTKFVKLQLGAEVTHAQNPKIAFELLSTNKYDLLMLDMEMPVMNGFNALQEIRTNKELKDLPVIACTALASPTLLVGLTKLKIKSYILKPSKASLIIERIKKALDKK